MEFNLKAVKVTSLFVITFGLVIALLQFLDIGCSTFYCNINGYHYGLRLFLGFLFLAAIGWVFLSNMQVSIEKSGFPIFYSIAIGMVILIAYIYARSLFNEMIFDAPISRAEIFSILIILVAVTKWKGKQAKRSGTSIHVDHTHLFISLAILLALCISIADRELPRLMLLSSDPDQHAFWGRQIARFGGIPFQQRDWGSQSFNYPAGSGTVLYVMQLLAGMDPRNSLVSLPILFTFFAALMIAEKFTENLKELHLRMIFQFSILALMAGGLMFPVYAQYVHGEGSGRQLSILFVGLLVTVFSSELTRKSNPSRLYLILSSLAFFTLIILNPANGMMPGVLLVAMVIYGWINRKQKPIFLLLTLAGGVALAMLDPYYQHLIGIGRGIPAESLVLNEKFTLLRPYGVAVHTIRFYLNESQHFFQSITMLLVEEKPALFSLLVMIYSACLVAIFPDSKITNKAVFSTTAFLITLYLVYGFTFAFINDQRFYLLGPYFFFSISQYKALFLAFLVLLIIKAFVDKKKSFWMTIILSTLLTWPTIILIRNSQDMYLAPRRDYCGALGCFPNDDKILLKEFQKLTRSGAFSNGSGVTPKVLIPNTFSKSDIEAWIFPVSSARVLPHYDVLPAAFYYYQGDAGYGTTSYEKHVCQKFDREWLLSKGIQYLYLPTERKDACIAGMESLVQTEKIILKQGNAYVLGLQP